VGPGPKARKRYLLVACTRLLTYYFLGDRSLATFSTFVFPDLHGVVVVHDRYQNYDAFPGLIHQLCTDLCRQHVGLRTHCRSNRHRGAVIALGGQQLGTWNAK
jgi:IS1 family transposase